MRKIKDELSPAFDLKSWQDNIWKKIKILSHNFTKVESEDLEYFFELFNKGNFYFKGLEPDFSPDERLTQVYSQKKFSLKNQSLFSFLKQLEEIYRSYQLEVEFRPERNSEVYFPIYLLAANIFLKEGNVVNQFYSRDSTVFRQQYIKKEKYIVFKKSYQVKEVDSLIFDEIRKTKEKEIRTKLQSILSPSDLLKTFYLDIADENLPFLTGSHKKLLKDKILQFYSSCKDLYNFIQKEMGMVSGRGKSQYIFKNFYESIGEDFLKPLYYLNLIKDPDIFNKIIHDPILAQILLEYIIDSKKHRFYKINSLKDLFDWNQELTVFQLPYNFSEKSLKGSKVEYLLDLKFNIIPLNEQLDIPTEKD